MTWRKPIPENARMVFKGQIFEVWQWDQLQYDGTTKVFERLKRPDTVDIIATVGDKIIVLDQEQPDTGLFVSLPSGRVDDGEDTLSAAKRELLEETGYASSDWSLVRTDQPSGKIEWTVYLYLGRNCAYQQEQSLDSGERISVRLISFDEFLMIPDDPSFRMIGSSHDMLLRARYDATKRDELHKIIFGV